MQGSFSDRFTWAVAAVLAPLRRRQERAGRSVVPGRPYPWEKSYPDGVAWDLETTAKSLPDLLDEAVAAFGERNCINFRGRRFTYNEIGDQVSRAACGFRALGVDKGIKVGLMLPNCPYTVICYYAVLKAGGTGVQVNPLYAEREIARQVDDSGACILVTLNLKTLYKKVASLTAEPAQLERLVICSLADVLPFREKALFSMFKRGEIASIPKDEHHLTFEKLIDNDAPLPPVDIDPVRDVAVLQYTGGTTGVPKGAMLTHANIVANARQLLAWCPGVVEGES